MIIFALLFFTSSKWFLSWLKSVIKVLGCQTAHSGWLGDDKPVLSAICLRGWWTGIWCDPGDSPSLINICLQLSLTLLWIFLPPCSQWRVSPQPAQGPHGLPVHGRQLRHGLPVPPGRPEDRPADAGRPAHAQRPGHGPRWPRHRGRLPPGPPLTAAVVKDAAALGREPKRRREPGGTVGGPKWRCIERASVLPKEG